MNKETDNLVYCDFAKMMLMLCVMICHSCILWSGVWEPFMTPVIECRLLGLFSNWLNTFHIYAFVLVSGYIYSYIRLEKKGYDNPKSFIHKKARRLLLPYYTITFFWLIPFAIILRDYNIKDYILKYVIGGGEQLWFLYMLFGVFVLFYFLEPFLHKYKYLSNILILFVYAIGCVLKIKGFNYFQIASSLQFMLFFWIGYNIRIYKDKCFTDNFLSIKSRQFVLLLFLLNIVVFLWYYSPYALIRPLLLIFLNIEGSVTAFSLFLLIGQKINMNNKFVNSLINNNFCMYLLHQQIIYICISALNGTICPLLNALANFLIALLSTWVLAILLRKDKLVSNLLCIF